MTEACKSGFGPWVEPDPVSLAGRRLAAHRRRAEVQDGARLAPAPRRRKPRDPLAGPALKRALDQAKLRRAWGQEG